VAFSLTGVYLTTMNPFDLYLMLALAVGALVLRWFDYPLAPLLLGFILSGLLEENVRRTLFIADGGWTQLMQPVTIVLSAAVIGIWLLPLWRKLRQPSQ
jgi:putative tricarboxylic transport membrane protein